ncbi:MAG: N-6 DNA methylase, partial [Cyanobacteriota bacterium]
MPNNFEKFNQILQALDYLNSQGLVFGENIKNTNHKNFIFNQNKRKLGLDGIYFVHNTPIIYFKYFSEKDEQQIFNFQIKAWNQGLAPLSFILMADELRIYSNYTAPVLKNSKASSEETLIAKYKLTTSNETFFKELKDFSRLEIDTGNFWRLHSKHFSTEERINNFLLQDLKELRKALNALKLDFKYINSIIGRSFFILHLEKRGILDEAFYKQYNSKFSCFADVLSSKTSTYNLFENFTEFFGKDVFPVLDKEKEAVSTKHLALLQKAFEATPSKTSDNYFWAYAYDIIPAEIICSIYEEFLYIEDQAKEMASSTPPALAKLMLDQVLPYNTANSNLTILDPACGSSIFLVESFKRLAEGWIIKNNDQKPTFNDLFTIIKTSIYGFDYNIEALKFTSAALYSSMLDLIEEFKITDKLEFSSIIGSNLDENDFFDSKSKLHKKKYDIIIGNPPWQSSYGEKANEYLKKTDHPVGDKQISQVFLWQAGDLINPNGSICLLMPSKGLLYNFNPKNIEFREKFFKHFDVKKIINLSLFSNLLFENSKFPASIIIYSLEKDDQKSASTVYYTPKPSNKLWEFSTLIVDPSNVKKLPKQQILKNHTIWKIAFVGTGRDFVLVNHLDKNFPKIDYICEDRDWKYGEGFQLGGGDKNINNDMGKMPYIPAKSIFPFYVNKEELDVLGKNTFHRPRDFALYKAPHTIVRGGQIYASYIDYDAVFTHAVMCFASPTFDDAKLLKMLAAYLNSSLVLYYLFLTSSTWCIERTDIHLAEYRTLPFTLPSDDRILDNILNTYDELSEFVANNIKSFHKDNKYFDLKDKLDNYIFDLFDLDSDQRQIILDINKYSINYFQDYSKSSKSKIAPDSTEKPDINNLKSYANLFCNSINKKILKYNYKLISTIHTGEGPLEIISFSMVPKTEKVETILIVDEGEKYYSLLKKLDNIVIKQTKESLYTSRNLRIYEGSTFYLVKPSEIRYWTNTNSLNDSDKALK